MLAIYGMIMKINIIYIVFFGLFYTLMELYCEIKTYKLRFSDYFRHLWNYNENKYHIYCVFRIILDTYRIIMRNKYHIYCVFRLILDIYGIIMRNKNHICCVVRINLITNGILM